MNGYEVYIGSFLKTADAAILKCDFDTDTGRLTQRDRLTVERPSYLCLSADKNTLYCIREAAEIDGVYGGGVASVDVSGEKMRMLSKQSTHAKGPSHLLLDGDRLIVSVYGEGAVTQFRLAEGGRAILPTFTRVQLSGRGADAERQTQSHPHYVARTPDGTHIAVCDLGLDRVLMFPYSEKDGLCAEPLSVPAPEGSGPRHLVFSRDGRFMYVLTEMGSTVLAYEYLGNGRAVLRETLSTVPADFDRRAENVSAAIRANPARNEIAVSNRVHDSIAFFGVGADGRLTDRGFVRTGLWPRDVEFSPDGRYLLAACQNSNTVDVYAYREGTEPAAERARLLPGHGLQTDILPCCVVFGKRLAD